MRTRGAERARKKRERNFIRKLVDDKQNLYIYF